MAFPNWPSYSNDTGLGQDGTEVDAAMLDAIESALETETVSATNPSVTTKGIKDEVVAARGNEASLDARISGVIDDDGVLVAPASIITSSQLRDAVSFVNLLRNDTYLMWSGGDAAIPDFWALDGSPTLARTGTGLGDTQRKVGDFAISITNAGTIYQRVLDAGIWAAVDHFETDEVSFGCWLYSSVASHVRLNIADGSSESNSSAHTGTPGWEWIELAGHTISAAATHLQAEIEVLANGTAYVSGPTFVFGGYAPPRHWPCTMQHAAAGYRFIGTPDTGDGVWATPFFQPFFIDAVMAYSEGACSGDFTIDVEVGDGDSAGTWNSIFSGAKAIINNTYRFGTAVPDGTYRYRCYPGAAGIDDEVTSSQKVIRLNFDAINGASDGSVLIGGRQFVDPLAQFKAYDDF